MNIFKDDSDKDCDDYDKFVGPGATDTQVQLVISLSLGISAFLAFCFLRPRWKTLYAARRRRLDPSVRLPVLPDSFLGWIPTLYRVTDRQVLMSAGLDAYVFLRFFKMAIKLFSIMFFFAAVVLEPINQHFVYSSLDRGAKSAAVAAASWDVFRSLEVHNTFSARTIFARGDNDDDNTWNRDMGYLWAYLVFTYFFTALTIYVIDSETFQVIKVRQDYLGSQSTITDRTFRLSNIPKDLRTEEKIKDLVERLEIGHVHSITLCRNWKDLDDMIAKREIVLRKLEEAWSVFLNQKPLRRVQRQGRDGGGGGNGNGDGNGDGDGDGDGETNADADGSNGNRIGVVDEEAGEASGLLERNQFPAHQFIERERPQTRVWYGFLRLQSQKIDSLDYYEEKLRRLDEQIIAARKKEYEPTGLAFVTMDSTAACQMAIQALIDPHPGQLLTKPAPAPSDVVWRNTYASRLNRRARSWTVAVFVVILSIVWLIPVAFLASVLSLCTIRKVFPDLATMLQRHEVTKALIQTGLPTAVVSLLNVAVPYLYDYLSYNQGMLSQGDVALSVISKNFFFTFFNIFLVFTVFGTASGIISAVLDSLRDTTRIAYELARKIQQLSVFYLNFIMLQGVGLFPFRLLEIGSVSLYPILRMGAKTPRDFAELDRAPPFNYGFYLPTALLVFILCLVYSALQGGFLVLFLGLVYFALGHFTFKYQLLYAMEQPQHATGGAWRIICSRIILGLVVFQLTMSGVLALARAFTEALLVVPLLAATMWYSYSFRDRFEPLTRFISLRSVKRGEAVSRYGRHRRQQQGRSEGGDGNGGGDEAAVVDDNNISEPEDLTEGDRDEAQQRWIVRRGSTIDEDREKGLRFVNPSLVVPLEQPWIYRDPPPLPPVTTGFEADTIRIGGNGGQIAGGQGNLGAPSRSFRNADSTVSTSSSVSLGDTHIWRDS